MNFDWSDLAFASKKSINNLKAIFIMAPRELSSARFLELVKGYLPRANIVLGLAKEGYVFGLENQEQFRMLRAETVQGVIDKVNRSNSKHKIYVLRYLQHESPFLLEKLDFEQILFVNGSWQSSFHLRHAYYALVKRGVSYKLISPFTGEAEAKQYAARFESKSRVRPEATSLTSQQMMNAAGNAAMQSFDHTYQTGVALGEPSGKGYKLLATSFNKVVPYQTYAMHFGSLREKHFSPAGDLNYYDTVHAEVELLLTAQKQKIDLKGTSFFINLLPCPTCGRMLADSDIKELVYSLDHSDGYSIKLLEAAGKTVRRVV